MRLILTIVAVSVALLALAQPARGEWVWPLHGEVITMYRNGDDPYAGGQHRGIDIAGAMGTRVVAATGGDVRFAGTAGSSGLTVSVRTSDGRFDTSYLHLSTASVREGDSVSAGDALGAVGTTGSRSAVEPHLHFGVREAGSRHAYRDPLDFLPPRPAPPAPEPPPATPVPVPAPVRPSPSPVGEGSPRAVPVGQRAPRRVPVGGRIPRRVPIGGRVPRRVPVGGRAPRRVPIREPQPRGVPAGHPVPRGIPARVPAADGARRPVPVGGRPPQRVPFGRAPGRAPAGDPVAMPSPAGGRALDGLPDGAARSGPLERATPELGPQPGRQGRAYAPRGPVVEHSGGTDAAGPDIGWILACVGLLAAAAMLGLTEDGRKATRKGHGRLVRLLRPLTGRG
jgi:Peptidase family M23